MLAALLLVHDLGKSGRAASFYRKALPGRTVPAGHVELFSALLQTAPGYFPSLARLESHWHLILEVVKAHFNLPQFMQAECPAAMIAPIRGLSSDAYDLMVAEAVLDLAGAAGCAGLWLGGLQPAHGCCYRTGPGSARWAEGWRLRRD